MTIREATRRTPARLRNAAAVLALGLAVLALPAATSFAATTAGHGSGTAAAESSPGGRAGACTDADGVTVVADFTDLGGPVVERCAGWPVSSGFDALARAGFSVAQPTRTPGFVCRLQGRPTATESLDTSSDPTYREQCVNTPPTDAYWSYWYAPNGGRWTYSTIGASSHQAIRGGYEGWSFALNRVGGAVPPPRAAPKHAVPPTPTPPTSVPPTSTPPGSPHDTAPATHPVRPTDRPTSASSTPPAARVRHVRHHPTPHRSRTTAAPAAAPAPTTDIPSASRTTGALPAEPKPDSGSPLATIAGVCIVGLLTAVGGLTAWRRRTGAG